MNTPQKASIPVIKRLPKYYRYLRSLQADGITSISSRELASQMGTTASQVRQDFNCFGGFGQQGYGYNVRYLYSEIGKILGLDRVHNMIFVGAGNLGQALANYAAFERSGFKTVGIFDVNPVLKGISVRGIEIRMADELPEFIKEHHVEIAALTLPKAKAVEMAEILVDNGVKAIWNFAHVDLELINKDVVVENVHLSDSLMQLSYNIVKNQRAKENSRQTD